MTNMVDLSCRCCGKVVRVCCEDPCDLCVACFKGKGVDTDQPCPLVHAADEVAWAGWSARGRDLEYGGGADPALLEVDDATL